MLYFTRAIHKKTGPTHSTWHKPLWNVIQLYTKGSGIVPLAIFNEVNWEYMNKVIHTVVFRCLVSHQSTWAQKLAGHSSWLALFLKKALMTATACHSFSLKPLSTRIKKKFIQNVQISHPSDIDISDTNHRQRQQLPSRPGQAPPPAAPTRRGRRGSHFRGEQGLSSCHHGEQVCSAGPLTFQ